MDKKPFIINFKKLFLMYTTGFLIAYTLPEKQFFTLMNSYHISVNQKLEIIDKEEHYKII